VRQGIGAGIALRIIMQEQHFELEDGRTLAYAIYGDTTHRPVFYFHGTPSSRLEPLLLESYGIDLKALLQEAGLYLIAVDRPGMGGSDFNPRGSFISFASDVAELTAALNIARAAVLCWSGGGPYALAMAFSYPKLITQVSIICGFTRPFARDVTDLMGMNKWYFHLAKHTPLLLMGAMNLLKHKTVRSTVPQWVSGLPYVDYELIKNPAHFADLARVSLKEAAKQGARGPLHEARSYYHPFGFSLAAIQQPVHYWWGLQDMSVIRLHAEAIEAEVPNAIMHYRKGEGHLSLYVHYFRNVLQTLASSPAS
jgi:pimeloyl-ACP methyl ester carboxylesterase